MIPQEYVQEVVRRTDIEELVGDYVTLRHRGRMASGLCPFHNEKTPSFFVYPQTQSFYCFGCGASGDAISFLRRYQNLGYVEAVKALAARAGMPMPEEDDHEAYARQRLLEINRCAARYFSEQLNAPTPQAQAARAYWRERRGMTDASIQRFGLGYAPDDFTGLLHTLKRYGFAEKELETGGLVKRNAKGNLYDMFRNRVMVPILDLHGDVIAFGGRVLDDSKPKYINSPETAVYRKSYTLFAMNLAKRSKSGRFILCEGYMDVMSLQQAGFDTAVCACGTALTTEQVKILSQYAQEVVLCYDSDDAGRKATERSLSLFYQTNVKVSVLEIPGAKDPDEFIRFYGREKFSVLLNSAANPTEFALSKAKEKYDLTNTGQQLDYIREAVQILARNEVTPTARDVYAGRVAQQTSVSKSAVLAEVERQSALQAKRMHRQEQRDLSRQGIAADLRVLPQRDGQRALGAASAARQLAAAMLQDPAVIPYVRDRLDLDTIPVMELRQGIEAIFACAAAEEPVNLTSLSFRLDEKTLSQLALALAQNAETTLDMRDIDLFLQRLRDADPESRHVSGATDEEYVAKFQEIAKRKNAKFRATV